MFHGDRIYRSDGPAVASLKHCHLFATILRRDAPASASGGRIGGAQWNPGPNDVASEPGDMTMPTIKSTSAATISTRVWRDLAQLAVEALAIGVVFSVLLALAVFVVARGAHGDEFAGSQSAPTEIHAPPSMG
jgi:hypothetical protein